MRNCFAGDGINLDAWVGALPLVPYIGWSGFELSSRIRWARFLGPDARSKLVKHIRDKIMSYPGAFWAFTI